MAYQDFLVRIHVNMDSGLDAEAKEAITNAERVRGEELVKAGSILQIWRVPGTQGNVGIWRAPDATDLHALVSSLPLYEYMRIEVTALARHPLAPLLRQESP